MSILVNPAPPRIVKYCVRAQSNEGALKYPLIVPPRSQHAEFNGALQKKVDGTVIYKGQDASSAHDIPKFARCMQYHRHFVLGAEEHNRIPRLTLNSNMRHGGCDIRALLKTLKQDLRESIGENINITPDYDACRFAISDSGAKTKQPIARLQFFQDNGNVRPVLFFYGAATTKQKFDIARDLLNSTPRTMVQGCKIADVVHKTTTQIKSLLKLEIGGHCWGGKIAQVAAAKLSLQAYAVNAGKMGAFGQRIIEQCATQGDVPACIHVDNKGDRATRNVAVRFLSFCERLSTGRKAEKIGVELKFPQGAHDGRQINVYQMAQAIPDINPDREFAAEQEERPRGLGASVYPDMPTIVYSGDRGYCGPSNASARGSENNSSTHESSSLDSTSSDADASRATNWGNTNGCNSSNSNSGGCDSSGSDSGGSDSGDSDLRGGAA